MNVDVFDAFADLLSYPGDRFEVRFEVSRHAIDGEDAALGARIRPLARLLQRGDIAALEELYTRTFDMNPSCALEAGWHLYGEDYDRGAFLVHLRDSMRSVGVEETIELPDHMSNVLRLLCRMEVEAARRMACSQVQVALSKILAAFPEGENPYREIVAGAADLLTACFGPADDIPASAFSCPAPYGEEESGFTCPGMQFPHPE